MGNLRPNEKRAKNAITLIWIVLVLDIISLLSDYYKYELLSIVSNGGEISPELAIANDTRGLLLGLIYLIAFLISAITFIKWFRRAYFNLHQRVSDLAQTDVWAASSWFIPIVALYKPYQIMKELYQKTIEFLNEKGVDSSKNLTTRTLGVWWTLWLINNFLANFDFRFFLEAESIDDLTRSTILSMIGNILRMPLALITIKVIKDYSNLESTLYEIKDDR